MLANQDRASGFSSHLLGASERSQPWAGPGPLHFEFWLCLFLKNHFLTCSLRSPRC